jgi:hypothetical protein
VAGNYAYVAAGSAGLVVVEVNDHSAPVIVATLDTPGNANDVRIVGSLAYVADGDSGLQIVDVSTPANPVSLGSLDTPGEAYDVVVYGTQAYVADGPSGLQIINVSNPAAPALLGSAAMPGLAKGVDVSGDLVVVCQDEPAALRIIDAAIPSSPQTAGFVTLNSPCLDVEVRDRFAYVAAYTDGLKVIDFSMPASPRVVGGIEGLFYIRDVALGSRYAIGADVRFANAVPLIDLGDPSDPSYRGVINFSAMGDTEGTGVAIDDRYIYMTGSSDPFTLRNGQDGFTRLFIGEYQALNEDQVSDTAGVAPTVTVSSPQTGDSVIEGSRLPVSITATDDVKVALVQLIFNGVVVIRDVSAPYQITYRVPLGATSVTVEAKAFDVAGNSATSPPVTLSVLPDPPPTIAITSPAEGQELFEGQVFNLFADATDNSSIQSVIFTVNGETFFNGDYYFVPVGVTSLTFEATATDDVGHTVSTTRTVNVVPDPPPTVSITSPAEGAQLMEGALVRFDAEASDNISIYYVLFTVNGGEPQYDFDAPYTYSTSVPGGSSTLTLEVEAHDNLDHITTASRTYTVVPDPGTTVTGRVIDTSAQPVPNATVKVFDEFTAQTGGDGTFTLANVPTVRGAILARVTATIDNKPAANASQPQAPVSGGTTNLGDITLSVLPTAPMFVATADFTQHFGTDLLVGYPDRQSLIYTFNGSDFLPSTTTTLPYGAVSSGAITKGLGFGSLMKVFTQGSEQAGSVTDLVFQSGQMLAPATLSTGLNQESAYLASGRDQSGSRREILAFLAATGDEPLTVRYRSPNAVSDEFDEEADYTAPVVVPVGSSSPLRSLKLQDVNGDRRLDVLAIKPVSGTDARLVVILREEPEPENSFALSLSSGDAFLAPVESPITIRSSTAARGVDDFAFVGGGGLEPHLYVLGDDRVRVYDPDGSGTGAFIPAGEIILPAGQIPTGIAVGDLSNDSLTDVLVTMRDASAPETKSVLLYLRTSEGTFEPPTTRSYTAPVSSGDTRIVIGEWLGFRSVDAVVVDGEKVIYFNDIGPIRSGS